MKIDYNAIADRELCVTVYQKGTPA